jgi:hypothetical protein
MVYGDDPVKWNERATGAGDPMGLNAYTYVPAIAAVMQSGNLYVYCMGNPARYVDPTGELSLSVVHNWVVNDVQEKYDGMIKNKMVDYSFGFGFADLVNSFTGEVWEVKKSTISMTSAQKQLAKYTSNKLRLYPNLELYTGGTQGTIISPNSFIKIVGFDTYYVNYWDCGNGIVKYDYNRVTDWQKVGEVATGVVLIGGAAFLIYTTGGLAAPVLIPILA